MRCYLIGDTGSSHAISMEQLRFLGCTLVASLGGPKDSWGIATVLFLG